MIFKMKWKERMKGEIFPEKVECKTLKSFKRFLFPKVPNTTKLKHRSKKCKWKEKHLHKIKDGQVPERLKGFQSTRQESYQGSKAKKKKKMEQTQSQCFVKTKRRTVEKVQVEILKKFQKAFEKLKEDSRSRKTYWEETKDEGRGLNGKALKERWSLLVDAEANSSWKSCQVKRAHQVEACKWKFL